MRLHHLRPDELDADQRALYDVLTEGPRKAVDPSVPTAVRMVDGEGRLQGPFNALLHHPVLGTAVQEVSRRLRFDGVLPGRAREVVILVVAASQRSDFEWAAHASIARALGIPDDVVAAIARGTVPELADPVERAAAELALEVVTTGDAADATWDRVQPVLGDAGVVEVSTTVGVYQLIAQQLRLFRVPAPPGPW
jgi:4-carboxymuconolactone decarboxylase